MVNFRLRRAGPLRGWILAAIGGLIAAAALIVWTRTAITTDRYRLSALRDQGAVLLDQVERLRVEAAALSAFDRIESRAREMGLRHPVTGQVIDLPKADVALGTPTRRSP